ncbi:MAG TPA: LPS export ABC transporter periplasmic protein LptC [Acidocella sp.]|jgi:lipopolysaccharide export system protein LptC|uniref:LPS export ABC transporter periplasmic protein LptC n=1 Tax=Acidocella sp. TaxID=50710 RepID=UPI002C6E664A|nr:LPS export ABC transporter periplasmic protein LptC [Acidocella sp.]HVE20753.1 LPS export ABC transporter periplasmic protein LptC [Acidocella sp.]
MNPAVRDHMLDGLRRRNRATLAAIARRSALVTWGKKLLPLAAVALLVALGLAPSWHSGRGKDRVTYHISNAQTDNASRMQGARYHGVDQQGQPFTVTAGNAVEQGANNVALTQPVGDITLKSGSWLELRSNTGLFNQKSQTLNLDGNVTLYRNDGTTVTTTKASINMQTGSAHGTEPTDVQGPFGTLHADHGFVLANRGTEITFNGPATLVLTQIK